MGTRTAGAAAAAALALVAAGCGSNSSATTTSATVNWANSLCSAATTFKGTVRDAVSGLKQTPTKSGLQDAVQSIQTATQSFVESVKTLGAPDTESGQRAQQALTSLSHQLDEDLATIKSAGGQSAVVALTMISGTLANAKTQVDSTIDQLKQLDAKGELQQAFSDADACGQ